MPMAKCRQIKKLLLYYQNSNIETGFPLLSCTESQESVLPTCLVKISEMRLQSHIDQQSYDKFDLYR
jgi:hypothetical protein